MIMKQILQIIAYRSLYGVVYIISLLPMTLLYAMASVTFFLSYHVIGY